jgi:Helix-turn-helix domain
VQSPAHRIVVVMERRKLTPDQIAEMTDLVAGGVSFRTVARQFGVSPSTSHRHVRREEAARQRRAEEAREAARERKRARDRARYDRVSRAGRREGQPSAPVPVRPASHRIISTDGLCRVLDENDRMSDLRARRIRERGLHPLRATTFQLSADDYEWADYLASRTKWPPGVNPERATRAWKLGAPRAQLGLQARPLRVRFGATHSAWNRRLWKAHG